MISNQIYDYSACTSTQIFLSMNVLLSGNTRQHHMFYLSVMCHIFVNTETGPPYRICFC